MKHVSLHLRAVRKIFIYIFNLNLGNDKVTKWEHEYA